MKEKLSHIKILLIFIGFLFSVCLYTVCCQTPVHAYFSADTPHTTSNVKYSDVIYNDEFSQQIYMPFSDGDVSVNKISVSTSHSEFDINPLMNVDGIGFYKNNVVFAYVDFYSYDQSFPVHKFDHFAVTYVGDSYDSTDYCCAINKEFRFSSNFMFNNSSCGQYNNFYACYADKITCESNDSKLGIVDKPEGWIYEFVSGAGYNQYVGDYTCIVDPRDLKTKYSINYMDNGDGSYGLVLDNNDPNWTSSQKPQYKTFTVNAAPTTEKSNFIGFDYYINDTYYDTLSASNPTLDITTNGVVDIKAKFEVIKEAPIVTPPYSIDGLVENSQPQILCSQGTTSSGKLEYSLGEDDKTPPESGWSTDLPTAVDAGEYYIWYMVPEDDLTLPFAATFGCKSVIKQPTPPIVNPVVPEQAQAITLDDNTPYTSYSLPSTTDYILGIVFVFLLFFAFIAKPLFLNIKKKSQQPSL